MDYQLQFNVIWNNWDLLLYGMWLTVRISLMATVLGLVVGIVFAGLQLTKKKIFKIPIQAYIELIRSTPFLAQLMFIYFGLPSLGIRIDPEHGALIALIINVGAYSTEIMRAGIESIHKDQIEAGHALGLSGIEVFRYVIIPPALKNIFPALTSQFILIMLNSSIISVISAQELTYQANFLQSRSFRSFEVYITVTFLYLFLSYFFRSLFGFVYAKFFGRKKRISLLPQETGLKG